MTVLRVEVSNPAYSFDKFTNITVQSSHLNGRADITVYTDAIYTEESAHNTASQNIPIVVLLHGVYGSHWVWSQLGGVHQVYEQLRSAGLNEFVLVMPSDGCAQEGSGYLPLCAANYEKWIVEDVIAAVCENIQVCSAQSNKYITGLSMGGYGALRLGVKYPRLFAAISAHSSITELEDFSHFVNDKNLDLLRSNNDKFNGDVFQTILAMRDSLPPLRFDCGEDDVLFSANLKLADNLKKANIPHQFDRFSGAHEWEYWHEHIAQSLRYFAEIESNL